LVGIDTIDPAYYTVADGDGQTTAPHETDLDVGGKDLPRSATHPFYTRLNQILDSMTSTGYVEGLCQRFDADEIGRPGLPPGRYFRLLLIGYFEGLDAERENCVACR
jgi:transposase